MSALPIAAAEADAVLLVLGWTLAAASGVAAAVLRARLDRVHGTVARVAHEIRGPLCAARLALDAGADARRLHAVDLELRRAGLAVEDLGAAPAGGSMPARADAVDVAELVEAAADGWRTLVAAHGSALDVVAPSGAWMRGDRLRLAQAIANLVANAAEHGDGTVRVRVRNAGGEVAVSVHDDGPGLPAPLDALAGRPARGRRGHGLAVAATVARRHGGALTHVATPRGTCLELRLPVTGSAGAREERAPWYGLAAWRPGGSPSPMAGPARGVER